MLANSESHNYNVFLPWVWIGHRCKRLFLAVVPLLELCCCGVYINGEVENPVIATLFY